MNKDYIKEKWAIIKPKAIVLACLICSFLSGFGAGRGEANFSKPVRRQLNYTTNNTKNSNSKPTSVGNQNNKNTATNNANNTEACVVKGNIASGGKKTYHIQGGVFYERTNAEQCFVTEAEAQAAGFTKSSR